jgi:hypothetical protein
MQGKITRISVTWTTETDQGKSFRFYGLLPDGRKIIRPDRMHELLDDLTVMCEQIQAARDSKPNGAGSPHGHELRAIK